MSKCQECGQDIPKVFKAGDIVEFVGVMGIIPGPTITRILDAEYGKVLSGEVRVVGFDGQSYSPNKSSVTVRHGYIHVERD